MDSKSATQKCQKFTEKNLQPEDTKYCRKKKNGTCGLSVTTFFHQVLNYYYLTVYIMFKPKMSLG